MSSYLFVLAVGDFERLAAKRTASQSVSSPRAARAKGRFALDNAIKLLASFNEYFGVKYPLPKLDLIAVPGGFGGAMENWGGITFFESRLLFDPATNPDARGAASSASSRMKWRINGSAISSPWHGGTISG